MPPITHCALSMCVALTLINNWVNPLDQTKFLPNTVLFTHVGKTSQVTGYAHMVNTFNFTKLYVAFDQLHDQVKAYYEQEDSPYDDPDWETSTDGKRQFYLLKMAYNKLRTLVKLLSSSTTMLDTLDEVNPYLDIVHNMTEKVNTGTPVGNLSSEAQQQIREIITHGLEDDALYTSRSDNTQRKRRSAHQFIKNASRHLAKLIGFGVGMLTNQNANQLYATSGFNETRFMLERIPNAKISMYKTINYIKKLADDNSNNAIRKLKYEKKSKLLAKSKSTIEFQITLLLNIVNTAMNLITSLMEKKLPVGILNPTALQIAFANLMTKIRENNYYPLQTDCNSVYQAETLPYVLSHDRNVIITFTMIPIQRGEKMDILHYTSTPLYLHNNLIAHVKAPHTEFLAMNKQGTLIKEYSSADIQSCKIKENVYHCPNNQIMLKDKYPSCLYNIFKQNVPRMLETCDITLDQAKNQAVQISGNTFRLLAPTETQITKNCRNHPEYINFKGMYLLNLTQDCPQAYTFSHNFHFNPQSTIMNKIISLPLNSDIVEWFGQTTITDIYDSLTELQQKSRLPISYLTLLEALKDKQFEMFLMIKGYTQDGCLLIFLLLLSYKLSKIMYVCCKRFIPCTNWKICRTNNYTNEKNSNVTPTAPTPIEMAEREPIINKKIVVRTNYLN